MTYAQGLSFALLLGAIAMFVWGRFRYDLVALVVLVIAMATGDVPVKQAFTGFTSDVVIIVGSALVVSAAIARSGVIEWAVGPWLERLRTARVQVPVLAGTTALLSMLTKNVGALAILMPVALRMSRKTGTSPSSLLMPMAFMSLLGGLVTLVGTSTNIIVSQIRQQELGRPFALFDFAPVGLVLTGLGLLTVSVAWRLLPAKRQGAAGLDAASAQTRYATEARITTELAQSGVTIAGLRLSDDGVTLRRLIGPDGAARPALPDAALQADSCLVLEGQDEALDRLFARVPLMHGREKRQPSKAEPGEEMRSIEAVVQEHSLLVGQTAQEVGLNNRFGVRLMGIGRSQERITERLDETTLRAGDVLVLRAGERALPAILTDLDLLPLFERHVKLGDRRRRFLPILVLAAAMLLVAFGVAPVAGAFFGAAVMMMVVGALSPREAYGALEPEVLVLLGALTPISEAVHHSGGSEIIAHVMTGLLDGVAPIFALGLMMAAAMACSPFLHNAPTVLLLGPVAVGVARGLHLNPDAFLMAVATGAGSDFLTPVGHQCNTLVMGPGGYRFGDYWRLGLPLSVMVIVAGTLAIDVFWPL